jgi:hypothetical protein
MGFDDQLWRYLVEEHDAELAMGLSPETNSCCRSHCRRALRLTTLLQTTGRRLASRSRSDMRSSVDSRGTQRSVALPAADSNPTVSNDQFRGSRSGSSATTADGPTKYSPESR